MRHTHETLIHSPRCGYDVVCAAMQFGKDNGQYAIYILSTGTKLPACLRGIDWQK